MNTIGKEIAREAARKAPLKGKLEGVKVGDIVYVGTHRDVLRPSQVEKVGKIHITAGGKKYAIQDGIRAGRDGAGSWGFIRAHPYSDDLRNAHELDILKSTFETELAAYRNNSGRMTKESLLAVIRALNPEAWK